MHSFRKSLTQLLKSKETIASPGKRLQFMGRENKAGVKDVNEVEDDHYANDYSLAELVDVNKAIDWSSRLGLDFMALRVLLINQPVKAKSLRAQRSAYAVQRAKERAAEARAQESSVRTKTTPYERSSGCCARSAWLVRGPTPWPFVP